MEFREIFVAKSNLANSIRIYQHPYLPDFTSSLQYVGHPFQTDQDALPTKMQPFCTSCCTSHSGPLVNGKSRYNIGLQPSPISSDSFSHILCVYHMTIPVFCLESGTQPPFPTKFGQDAGKKIVKKKNSSH